jgi:hypothetical protein
VLGWVLGGHVSREVLTTLECQQPPSLGERSVPNSDKQVPYCVCVCVCVGVGGGGGAAPREWMNDYAYGRTLA